MLIQNRDSLKTKLKFLVPLSIHKTFFPGNKFEEQNDLFSLVKVKNRLSFNQKYGKTGTKKDSRNKEHKTTFPGTSLTIFTGDNAKYHFTIISLSKRAYNWFVHLADLICNMWLLCSFIRSCLQNIYICNLTLSVIVPIKLLWPNIFEHFYSQLYGKIWRTNETVPN